MRYEKRRPQLRPAKEKTNPARATTTRSMRAPV
jgi:hypothetical protein